MTTRMRSHFLVLASAVALGALTAAPALATEAPGSEKLQRQLELFEKMTNQMLLDSPNFLVSGRSAARALYIEEFGVVVSWNASLVEKGEDGFKIWNWDNFKVERDGDRVIIVRPEGSGDKEDDEAMVETYKKWIDKQGERRAQLYEAGKVEMVDLLMDYAEVLSRLDDSQWVMLAAFLGNNEFFEDNDLSRCTVKARMSDLRAYGAGDIDHAAMEKRLVIQEY